MTGLMLRVYWERKSGGGEELASGDGSGRREERWAGPAFHGGYSICVETTYVVTWS